MKERGKKTFNWGIIGTGTNAFSKDLDFGQPHGISSAFKDDEESTKFLK